MGSIRTEILLIVLGLIAWFAVFTASAQGLLHVSWVVSDGILGLLAGGIFACAWRLWRRRGAARG